MKFKKIDEARREKEMTVTELCQRVGVHRDFYYKVMRSERMPRFEIIVNMCKELGIDVNELL